MTAARRPEPPPGFVRIDDGDVALYVRREWAEAVVAAHLGREDTWRRGIEGAAGPSGRGATTIVRLSGAPPLLLKELRRGGAAARARSRSFRGTGRLLANLRDPDLLADRGVATPRAGALLLVPRGTGHYGGYLAVVAIEGAEDLRRKWSRRGAGDAELDAVLETVRAMHDAGFRHRDLNLGNLLVAGDPPAGFVVDLDGGAWGRAPLGAGARSASLRRMERSYARVFPEPGPLGPRGRDRIWERYALGDAVRGSAILRRRWTGRVAVAWHRLGWGSRKRGGS